MCGIFGIVANNGTVDADLLEQGTRSLAHRGPDDSGAIVISEESPDPVQIGLGNRRLAILDLSPLGHQPMQDSENGNWITYNGEIYNFPQVREKLERDGIRFRSRSDTEVLLKAYGRWGQSCLAELRGMFAFAIWDTQRRRLFVARDPMGIKPLYYAVVRQNLLFASELRTLLGTGLLPRRLDRAGLLNYLMFGSLYDPVTLVDGVSVLPPGYFLTWEKGKVETTPYWDLAKECDTAHSAEEALDRVKPVLDESVRMQMVSDVPVGVFLSGGIDSSVLAAILSRDGAQLHTFSVVFREADYTESEYSRLLARKFGSEHKEILVSQQDAFAAIPEALQAMDQPTIDGLNTYLISRHTRAAGIKVALSGLGGDELFAGYSTFRTVPKMEQFERLWRRRVPEFARKLLASGFAGLSPASDQNRKLAALACANANLLHPYFLSRQLFTAEQYSALLAFPGGNHEGRAHQPLRESLSHTQGLDPINRVSYLEARCYMLNTLLRDADVMSMANGLEVRVPLIDHHLAETMLAIPGTAKLSDSTPKPLLVGALDGALPEKIVHRKKRGFTLPFEHWLRDELRAEVEAGLARVPKGPLQPFLDPEAVQRVWREFQAGKTSWSRPWSLYVLERWCELQRVSA